MLVSLLLLTLVNQSVKGSPFNFPDESNSGNNRNGEMIMPGIYFHADSRAGKSFDIQDAPAAISFGSSEPVRLPSLTSIMFSSRVDPPKQDDPRRVNVIGFGDNSANVAIGFDDGTADKSDDKVNLPIFLFDETNPAGNNEIIIPKPILASIENVSKLENETGNSLKQGFPVVIIIDDKPVVAVFHFSNSTIHEQNSATTDDVQTSSQSPVLFFNHREDEFSTGNVESTNHFFFPTLRSTDVPVNNQDSPVILNAPVINTCESEGFMQYNNACYKLLSSEPCENGSWLISKDGYSAECEQRQCAINEVFFNNSCVDREMPNICPGEQVLKINQSGLGYCQYPNGYMLYQETGYRFLDSDPCGEENWLLLRDLNNAVCAPRPCPKGEIFYDNTCINPENETLCASGQDLYVDLTGEAFCDCKHDYIYIPQDGNCIPEYEQGYCDWGEYIVRNAEEDPECVPNPCGKDGSVYHTGNERCYNKKYIGLCKEEYLFIEGEDAECGEIEIRNIFEVPTLRRCPRGSARDYLHECRRRFSMPSMSSVLNAPHLYGGCSRGFTKGPGGRCKKIVNLFG